MDSSDYAVLLTGPETGAVSVFWFLLGCMNIGKASLLCLLDGRVFSFCLEDGLASEHHE